MNEGNGNPVVRAATIVACLFVMLAGCSGARGLTDMERQKLDPQLTMILRDEAADSDLDVGIRKDGSKEYGVIIRSKNVEEIQQAGIRIGSVFSDVVTARVTIPELKKLLGLASVRAVQASSKDRPH